MQVTCVHTNAKKIVFPNAIFRKALNNGCGILGAVYKKVIIPDNSSQYQCDNKKKKKKPAPAKPITNKTAWRVRFALVQAIRGEGSIEEDVKYQ